MVSTKILLHAIAMVGDFGGAMVRLAWASMTSGEDCDQSEKVSHYGFVSSRPKTYGLGATIAATPLFQIVR
jgi:hypothetical protein